MRSSDIFQRQNQCKNQKSNRDLLVVDMYTSQMEIDTLFPALSLLHVEDTSKFVLRTTVLASNKNHMTQLPFCLLCQLLILFTALLLNLSIANISYHHNFIVHISYFDFLLFSLLCFCFLLFILSLLSCTFLNKHVKPMKKKFSYTHVKILQFHRQNCQIPFPRKAVIRIT